MARDERPPDPPLKTTLNPPSEPSPERRIGAYRVLRELGQGGVGTVYLAARASVLEPYASASVFPNHGQRVVNGYRLMQPASDIFLGWSQGPKRHFFFRQVRDMKISIMVETFGQAEKVIYAGWCARALALSHARSSNSAALSGYMGKSGAFDRAIVAFSTAYADQNERDHAALDRAVRKGKVKAVFEQVR